MSRKPLAVLLIFVFAIMSCETVAYSRPLRWRARKRPVVVVPAPKPRPVHISDHWGPETITREKISSETMIERKVKPGYGLIDFEVYPSSTKVYIDGKYKGTSRTLNKERYSPKVEAGNHVIELKKKNAPIKIVKVLVESGYKTVFEQR